jgi:hypothetical protein
VNFPFDPKQYFATPFANFLYTSRDLGNEVDRDLPARASVASAISIHSVLIRAISIFLEEIITDTIGNQFIQKVVQQVNLFFSCEFVEPLYVFCSKEDLYIKSNTLDLAKSSLASINPLNSQYAIYNICNFGLSLKNSYKTPDS